MDDSPAVYIQAGDLELGMKVAVTIKNEQAQLLPRKV